MKLLILTVSIGALVVVTTAQAQTNMRPTHPTAPNRNGGGPSSTGNSGFNMRPTHRKGSSSSSPHTEAKTESAPQAAGSGGGSTATPPGSGRPTGEADIKASRGAHRAPQPPAKPQAKADSDASDAPRYGSESDLKSGGGSDSSPKQEGGVPPYRGGAR